MFIKELID